jgi:hypothetical protein
VGREGDLCGNCAEELAGGYKSSNAESWKDEVLMAIQGALYTIRKFRNADAYGLCRKMRWMQQEKAMLSRWQFLQLCVAGTAGPALLSLAGCGGSQDGGGENDDGDRKKDEKDGGGGGAGGGY